MGVVLKRARFFLTCSGKYYGGKDNDPIYVRRMILTPDQIRGELGNKQSEQLSIFDYLSEKNALNQSSAINPNTQGLDMTQRERLPESVATSGMNSLRPNTAPQLSRPESVAMLRTNTLKEDERSKTTRNYKAPGKCEQIFFEPESSAWD
jgi:hypothetical protein